MRSFRRPRWVHSDTLRALLERYLNWNPMAKILIVEDDATTRTLLRAVVQSQGHRSTECRDGAEGLRVAMEERPDLAILDVNLPGLSGLEVCAALRRAHFGGAIILVTARQSVEDRVRGLGEGADDYLCKPFDIRELQARIAALLRRDERKAARQRACRLGDIEVDLGQKVALKDGRPFSLTKTEWSLLELLLENEGRPVSRERILDSVWGYEHFPSTRTVDTHVYRLRRKLGGEVGALIRNVHGEGYALATAPQTHGD